MGRLFAALVAGLLSFTGAAWAQTSCNAPAADIVTIVALPGAPFAALPSADGCTIFVSMNENGNAAHLAVLTRANGRTALTWDLAIPGDNAGGMALSRRGDLLAVSNDIGVALFDVKRVMAGDGRPLVQAKDEAENRRTAGSVYVAITPDDKLLFVSDENRAAITVHDLVRLRGGDAKPIGRIPVGNAPVGLVFSPDGKALYSTSEISLPDADFPICPNEGGVGGPTLPGQLTVIDVARAATDPAASVLARVKAGCDPVRIALSRDGSRAFVTARGEDSLLIFDTARLTRDPGHALAGKIIAGKSPVGVVVTDDHVVTANSNRFAQKGRTGEWLSVIDPVTASVIGNVPAGLFPRELSVTDGDKTLIVTNFSSRNVELVDLTRLTPAYFSQQKPVKAVDDAELARLEADRQARIAAKKASPGSEDALRKFLAAMAAKTPDYDDLAPALASAVRTNPARLENRLEALGPLRSVKLVSITPQDADVYQLAFAYGEMRCAIALSPEGKIAFLLVSGA